jgi:hypothetical protein
MKIIRSQTEDVFYLKMTYEETNKLLNEIAILVQFPYDLGNKGNEYGANLLGLAHCLKIHKEHQKHLQIQSQNHQLEIPNLINK